MAGFLEALEKAMVKQRRKRLSNRFFAKYGGTIQQGLFAGLRLDGDANISRGPLALKIFGLYEAAVMEAIRQNGLYGDAVNIGAADGYFSLGLLKAGLAERSICFEITEAGREAIRRNAEANGLSDRVVIYGKADETIGSKLEEAGFRSANGLMICDIEGAEFDILSAPFLAAVAGATVIIELHDRIVAGPAGRRERLIGNLPAGYRHEVMKSVPAQWAGIADLEALSDNDRALVTSEGRKAIGEWLVARPEVLA